MLVDDENEDKSILTLIDPVDSKTSNTTLGTFPYPQTENSYAFRIEADALVFDSRQTSKTILLLSRQESKELLIDGVYQNRESSQTTAESLREKALSQIIEFQNGLQFSQVKIADRKAYLNGENGCFTILDVRDPTSPVLLSQYQHPAKVVSYAIEDTLLYLCDTSSTLSCLSALPSASPASFFKITLPAEANQMIAHGHALLLATDEGLSIYDYAQPNSPRLMSDFKTPKRCFDVVTSGTQAIVATNGKIAILDIANPARPQLRREIQIFAHEDPGEDDWFNYRLKRLGSYLYIIQMTSGSHVTCELAVMDLNNPDAQLRRIESPIEFWGEDDSSTTSSQTALTHSSTQGWTLGLPVSYSQSSGGQSGMNLFDLSDPDTPRLAGGYWRLSRGMDHPPVLFKDHIFIADGENGLLVLRRTVASSHQAEHK